MNDISIKKKKKGIVLNLLFHGLDRKNTCPREAKKTDIEFSELRLNFTN